MPQPLLPGLFRDFDEASTSAQRAYLGVVRIDLTMLVLAAAVSSYASMNREWQRMLYGAGAILLLAGLFCAIVLSRGAYEKTWYSARAAAETVKSLAWKYMLRAAPFAGDAASAAADAEFVGKLAAVLREHRELALSQASIGEPVTPDMRALREASLAERLAHYLEHRVQDQMRWYGSKAREHERRQQRWFAGIVAVQAIATVGAVLLVAFPSVPFNVASTLAALASALLAWTQLKRHRELAQSYSLAARELGLAATLAAHVGGEDGLSQFVNDTESAISREHTMWLARREAAT